MKWLIILILVGLSKFSFACSQVADQGFCQTIIDDTSIIVLGVKLGDHTIYDSTGYTEFDNIVLVGMPFKIIETLRGSIPYDTVTVWSEGHNMCTTGTAALISGDTFLIKLFPSTFSVDSLENLSDYTYPNSEWPRTTVLPYSNDTLWGHVYQDYINYLQHPTQFTHPEAWRKMINIPYQDFKQNLQNGLVCYDYTVIEETKLNSLKAYPNPCTNVLHLEIDNVHEYQITLHDAMGKVISADVVPLNKQVDVSSLTPGVYFLTIQDKKNRKSVKFVKWAD